MKKTLSTALTLVLLFNLFAVPSYALGMPDAITAATTDTWTEPAPAPTVTTKADMTTMTADMAGATTHTVVYGDMMWKIAQKHGMTLDALIKLNPQIKNANLIYVGQKIIVKAAPAATPVVTPVVAPVVTPVAVDETLYMGLGQQTNFRNRNGNFSFNIVTASALFDADGKIVNVYFDSYEVGQSEGFPGWPGMTKATTEEGAVPEVITEESVTAEVAGWESKRELGDDYGMSARATTGNEWYEQLDYYQTYFVGKTVAEIRTWFDKSTGATGKPIVAATTTDEAELAKIAAMTEAEKAELADVVTSATMSLHDSHGYFIEALEEAYANKVEVK